MVTVIYNISRPEQGGVGRYVYEILRRMRKITKFKEIDLLPSFAENNFGKLRSFLWKRKRFLIEHEEDFGDINHFLQTEIYYNIPGKNIVTFHNPPMYTKSIKNMYSGRIAVIRSMMFYRRYMDAIKTASFFVANSEVTKDGILEHEVEEDKVKVIPLGVDKKFKITKTWEKRGDIIGYVGSFAYHKRTEKAIKDWSKNFDSIRKFSLNLYGAGARFKEFKDVYNNKFNIRFFGGVDEKSMVDVMNSFKAFIFPTKGESFGLPIIEAVACGCPAFVYKDSKITPEVKKYCFEIEKISEIPDILEKISRKGLVKKSKEVKEKFDWDKNVRETIKIYENV